jgi:uncharacterized protein Yka (UPF0111/DUF47 family)
LTARIFIPLAVALDDIVDYIDAAARAILMYDIKEVNDHARRFPLLFRPSPR